MQELKDRGVDNDSSGDEDSDSDDKDLPYIKKKTIAMMIMMISIPSVNVQECNSKNVIKVQEYSQELHYTQEEWNVIGVKLNKNWWKGF